MGFLSEKIQKRALDWELRPSRGGHYGGLSSIAGSDVTEKTTMGIPAVWAAVNFYGTVIGSLPFGVYRHEKNGSSKATDHPAHKIVHTQANRETVAMVYRERVLSDILLAGRSYSEKVKGAQGALSELWPIPPHRVTPNRSGLDKYYTVTLPTGGTVDIDHSGMLEIVGPYGGACVLGLLKESLGLTITLNEFASRFFGSGTHPGAVVKHPNTLSADGHSKLKNTLVDKYSGLGLSHRLMLLDEGMTIEKLGVSPEEAQAIQSRTFQIDEIARIFNLPPHILKELSRSTNNNIEQQSLEAVVYSLGPMARRIENHMDAQLLTPKEQQTYFFKHNFEGLLRGDSQARSEFYWKMFQMGAFSINDILRLEDKNTIGADGDKRYVMSNMVPIDQIGMMYGMRAQETIKDIFTPHSKTIVPQGVEPRNLIQKRSTDDMVRKRDEIKRRMLPLLKRDIQQIVNKESKAVKNTIGKKQGDEFREWASDFYRTFPDYVKEKIGETIRTFALAMKDVILDEIGVDNADIEQDIAEYVDGFAKQYSNVSLGQILRLFETDPDQIEARMDEWAESKAEAKATRQSVTVSGMVSHAVILGAGMKLMWVARGKSCPYCTQLDGAIVGSRQEYFIEGGTVLDGQDGKSMTVERSTKYPQLHDGCDCNIIAV